MAQINNSFVSGGMSLALSEAQFSAFIQFLKEDVSNLPIVKAVTHIGEQSSKVWVLNEDTQIDKDGNVLSEDEKDYIWLKEAFSDNYGNMNIEELIPNVTLPLSTNVLYT